MVRTRDSMDRCNGCHYITEILLKTAKHHTINQSISKRVKKQWEKEKLRAKINFSFSHSVFKRLVLQTHKIQDLFSLKHIYFTSIEKQVETRSRDSNLGPHDCEADALPHDHGHHGLFGKGFNGPPVKSLLKKIVGKEGRAKYQLSFIFP